MRKGLSVLAFVFAGTVCLGSLVAPAHAEDYPCPVMSIDALDRWHLGCMRSCHILDGKPDKYKTCMDKCNSDFDKCNDRRRQIQKQFNGK
jgi:hypothetical protein